MDDLLQSTYFTPFIFRIDFIEVVCNLVRMYYKYFFIKVNKKNKKIKKSLLLAKNK